MYVHYKKDDEFFLEEMTTYDMIINMKLSVTLVPMFGYVISDGVNSKSYELPLASAIQSFFTTFKSEYMLRILQ